MQILNKLSLALRLLKTASVLSLTFTVFYHFGTHGTLFTNVSYFVLEFMSHDMTTNVLHWCYECSMYEE